MIRTETVSQIQHKHSETYLVDKHWKVIFTLTEKNGTSYVTGSYHMKAETSSCQDH